MKKIIALIIILTLFLIGCNHSSIARAKNIGPSLTYQDLSEKLTASYDYDLGWWREIKVSSTLLHPLMRAYRKDIPETGTSFEFSIAGIEEAFIIERIIFTIEKNDGTKLIISGLNTDKILIKNANGEEIQGAKLIPLEKTGGPQNDLINRFILTVPIDITNAKWIAISADNTDGTFENRHLEFKWVF